MCGIAGIFHHEAQRPIDVPTLDRMNSLQFHRGPDQGGLFHEPGIGLAHRRLAILDLGGGRQPLFNETGSVVVVFNGEIYNFAELMAELLTRGHRFRTRSDTEVIVHAWEEWGEECVTRFRGMFAFALWDKGAATLFLARDRLGKKPLHYAELADGTVVFGSELKSVLAWPELPRRLDPHAVEDFFAFGYVPDPATIFQGIRKLAPAHCLAIRRGRPSPLPRRYWSPRFDVAARPVGEAELAAELVERLREAVRLRMIADVPLGAFLSGGVDSSAVVAMMAGETAGPVETCSIGFAEPAYDETDHASAVARRYRTAHRTRQVDARSFDLIDRLAVMYDEPFADSSAMPTYRVCQLAREQVTVALSGDGGDELFAGYRRYRWHRHEEAIRGLLPAPLRMPLFGLLGRVYPKMDWAPRFVRAKSTFQALARDSVAGYFHGVAVLADPLRSMLYSKRMRDDLGGYNAVEVVRRHFAEAPSDDPLSRIQYVDLNTYLPGDILTKVDRASMAVSLEVRVPMLDHHFVEWACSLPAGLKLRGREGKYILKTAMAPFLPHDLMHRPKMGFAVPLAAWFRGPLRDHVRGAATGPALSECGLFDPAALRTLADRHQSGRADYSAALWSMLMFESFLRLHGLAEARQPAMLAEI